jgi:hypothetical protein
VIVSNHKIVREQRKADTNGIDDHQILQGYGEKIRHRKETRDGRTKASAKAENEK